MSLLTRTDQKFLSFALSSLWKLMPGLAGLSCRSKAVVLTAFCSSPVNRARLSVKVSAIRNSVTSDSEHLHDFITKVINHLDGDSSLLRPVEWARGVAIQARPRIGIDLGLQCCFQRAIRVVRSQEIRVANEKTFLVVIGVN